MPVLEIAESAMATGEAPAATRLAAEAGELLSKLAPSTTQRLEQSGSTAAEWLQKAEGVSNPYLHEFKTVNRNPAYLRALDVVRCRVESTSPEYLEAYKLQFSMRLGLTNKYSWSIPNAPALAAIGAHGDIVEAGAGSGYWSSLLREMDTDVVAFDKHGMSVRDNHFHKFGQQAWTNIIKGDAKMVAQYPNRTLFMSFPPDGDPFADDVLRNYRGDKFVYVGEDRGGVTGDERFFDQLEKGWKETGRVEIPRWQTASGPMQDEMILFERR